MCPAEGRARRREQSRATNRHRRSETPPGVCSAGVSHRQPQILRRKIGRDVPSFQTLDHTGKPEKGTTVYFAGDGSVARAVVDILMGRCPTSTPTTPGLM